MTDDIEVSVWSFTGTEWATVSSATYSRLEFETRHGDVGVWSMTLPQGAQAEAIAPGRLVTTKFRGELLTWTVQPRTVTQDEDGELSVTIGGFDALSMLGWALAWPAPASTLGSQPLQGNYSGPAETVIRSLVVENLGTRYGLPFEAPASGAHGSAVRSKPRFDNLLTEVLRVAERGGIGVRFGLVPTSGQTRAKLTLSFYVPTDKTIRVRLAASDGSLSSWELSENAPTATRAIVGAAGLGSGQYFLSVTTTASTAAAATWGGHREVYVDGPETTDDTTIRDPGEDALAEGAASTTLTMEAQEPAGTKAFLAFNRGDQVTGVPYEGVEIKDVVQAIRVTHEEAGVPEVTPIFGDPDADDPDALTSKLIRALRRDVANLKTNRKRV